MAELAMVTGASSGIGQAYAERLARDGWDLVVVARRRELLEALARRLTDAHGITVRVLPADLAAPDQLQRLTDEVVRLPLGMLVNNAALAHYMPFAELSVDRAQELMQLNVLAPVLLSRAAVNGMIERSRGAVINIASLLAFSGTSEGPNLPARVVYAASKSFLVTFSQLLAAELKGRGVRVQVVCPGVVRSEFHTRQGIDLSSVPRMEPDAVVQASLMDLERGEVLCIPGLEDAGAAARVDAAFGELMSVTRVPELPGRYR
ncbi:MAG TPA: SDR family oxidoreductase [Candidatus Dormibacteraeota bacterium]